ncbi:MAG: methyltransferase [Cocleimonas sp.]|nr:methyltransferase [Cocleimonas sp.]
MKKQQPFHNALGTFWLQRFPLQSSPTLQAWDAADEYLLAYCVENKLLNKKNRLLIINDQFGALHTSLQAYPRQSWSDSYLNQSASLHNLRLNQFEPLLDFVPSTSNPQGMFELVLIKIPKTLALLEDQLIKLKPHINAKTQIISAAMTRNLHTSTLKLFEKILGTTRTTLAKKKARLVLTEYKNNHLKLTSPYPNQRLMKPLDLQLQHHANVFSKSKLDLGSLLMIEQFKHLPTARFIVDLACGSGVLGIMAKRHQPESQINFLDESYMAVASAQLNYESYYYDKSRFIVGDSLSQFNPKQAIDLILCNPPFHQQHALGDQMAWRMFTQSFKQLTQGGVLWIVGNRHLHYQSKLKKIFGNSQLIIENKKFQVISAYKK